MDLVAPLPEMSSFVYEALRVYTTIAIKSRYFSKAESQI